MSPSCVTCIRAAPTRRPSSCTVPRLKDLPDSYKRYLENFFRKRFKLIGTPVSFLFREGANPYEGKKNPLTDRQIARKRRLMKHVKGK